MCLSSRANPDNSSTQLWRYYDPVLGPRQLPVLSEPLKGKVLIPSTSTFEVDGASGKVFVATENEKYDLGSVVAFVF